MIFFFSFIHLFVHFHYLFAKVEEKVFFFFNHNGKHGHLFFSFCWSSFVFFLFLRVSLRSFFPGPGARGYFLAIYFFFPFLTFFLLVFSLIYTHPLSISLFFSFFLLKNTLLWGLGGYAYVVIFTLPMV
jgi:hypothetical protein